MRKILTTFSGKFGDILWSLPTVREVSRLTGTKVDFACMPTYRSLIPLLEKQSYINKAFVVEDWQCLHSNHGDQPWNPPTHVEADYEQCWHLGYRGHPGINAPNMPLMEFTAYQQGVKLQAPVIPFIEVPDDVMPLPSQPYIVTAFNEQYSVEKRRFQAALLSAVNKYVEVIVGLSVFPWLESAYLLKNSLCFVGCRSANYVLAHGVGAKVIGYEPHPARNMFGFLGKVFSCPYSDETTWPVTMNPEEQAARAAQMILNSIKEKENASIES